jgi:hypothetical protein
MTDAWAADVIRLPLPAPPAKIYTLEAARRHGLAYFPARK